MHSPTKMLLHTTQSPPSYSRENTPFHHTQRQRRANSEKNPPRSAKNRYISKTLRKASTVINNNHTTSHFEHTNTQFTHSAQHMQKISREFLQTAESGAKEEPQRSKLLFVLPTECTCLPRCRIGADGERVRPRASQER